MKVEELEAAEEKFLRYIYMGVVSDTLTELAEKFKPHMLRQDALHLALSQMRDPLGIEALNSRFDKACIELEIMILSKEAAEAIARVAIAEFSKNLGEAVSEHTLPILRNQKLGRVLRDEIISAVAIALLGTAVLVGSAYIYHANRDAPVVRWFDGLFFANATDTR